MENAALGLYDLHCQIEACVAKQFAQPVWVVAEIVGLNENRTGHCYLELIEKNADGVVKAKAKATIWASLYISLRRYFMQVAQLPLSVGMVVALQVEVVFHPHYGYSLNVKDINPEYTIGNRLLQRNKVIERLQAEGVFEMNKEMLVPLLAKRLAVVSAQTAAGYGDFMRELTQNEWGFAFDVTLFPALMQGEAAEKSMLQALSNIAERADEFDAVVMVRGGGAVSDLSCFDGYELAYLVTQMPLPVVSGIGHDRDVSVLDMVASVALKTPTAVAQFFVQKMVAVYQQVLSCQDRIATAVQRLLQQHEHRLQTFETLLPLNARRCVEQKQHQLQMVERSIDLLSPQNILKKGYTMTLKNGEVVSFADIQPGDDLTIVFFDGSVTTKVGGGEIKME